MVAETRIRLDRLKRANKCAIAFMAERTDAVEHTFTFLECNGCDDKSWCRKIVREYEKEMNLGV